MESVLVSWSGGKDSALALYEILQNPDYTVAALLTTVTQEYGRISMHGVRRELLERQAASLGFPLEVVSLSKDAPNEEYEEKMSGACARYRDEGVRSVVFGDIYLEDVRAYREARLAALDMRAFFPLWGRNTQALARSLIALGFKAITTCVDGRKLGSPYVGRTVDEKFLSQLPPLVDACGENGEYHSFVYDGPIFGGEIPFTLGEISLREDRWWYCDLIPE